jgi:hypothetical protein
MSLLIAVTSYSAERLNIDAKTKNQLQNLLAVNEQLHDSFFHYDAQKVENNAKEVAKAIGAIDDQKIKKLLSFAQKKVEMIKAENPKMMNNKNLGIYSMALMQIIKKYNIGNGYNAFYCPMAKKYWIQKGQKVENPFMKNMPGCGEQKTYF